MTEAQFLRLWKQRGRVVHYLQTLGAQSADADDAMAEAFTTTWRHRDRLEDERQLLSYVFTCAKHAYFARCRTNRRELPADTQPENGRAILLEPEGSTGLERIDERITLQQHLAARNDVVRWPAFLLKLAGHRYNDICEILDQSYTATNRHISEARAELKEVLT